MGILDPSETLRRICLAYPWSQECTSIAPIVPTDGEMKSMWNGQNGLTYASGKNIPTGAQCESVQLVPVDQMGVAQSLMNGTVTSQQHAMTNGIMHQFTQPRIQALDFFPLLLAREYSIKNFI